MRSRPPRSPDARRAEPLHLEAISCIEEALCTLLDTIAQIDLHQGGDDSEPIRVFSVAEWQGIPTLTRRDVELGAVLRHPVRGALKNAVALLGRKLWELTGDTAEMRAVAHRAARDGPGGFGKRMSIVDHCWDAIGTWTV
jgi:hypothetical protein